MKEQHLVEVASLQKEKNFHVAAGKYLVNLISPAAIFCQCKSSTSGASIGADSGLNCASVNFTD